MVQRVLKEEITALKKTSNNNLRSTSRASSYDKYDEKMSQSPYSGHSAFSHLDEKGRKNSWNQEKKVRFHQEQDKNSMFYDNDDSLTHRQRKNKNESYEETNVYNVLSYL